MLAEYEDGKPTHARSTVWDDGVFDSISMREVLLLLFPAATAKEKK